MDPIRMEREFKGLSPEDHGILNGGNLFEKNPPEYYQAFRDRYRNDPLALEEIDVYQPGSDRRILNRQLVEALRTKNNTKATEILQQISKRYPLMSARYGTSLPL